MESSPHKLEDAFLYGAYVQEVALADGELRIQVHFSEEQADFYDLEPQLTIRSCTLVFEGLVDAGRSVQSRPGGLMGRPQHFQTAAEFLPGWEASDAAWSLDGVTPLEGGGSVIGIQQAGEFFIDAERCSLVDVAAYQPDPRYPVPVRPLDDSLKQFTQWQTYQYVQPMYAQMRLPRYLALVLGGSVVFASLAWTALRFQWDALAGLAALGWVVWNGGMLVIGIKTLMRNRIPAKGI